MYIYRERSINILYTHRWAETESDTETEAERETENPQESQFKPQGGDQKHPEQSTQG